MAKRMTSSLIPLRPRQKAAWPKSPSDRMRELLKRRDITHLIRSMPVPDLYNFVRQLGLNDAGELLSVASSDQIQQMTDLEVWRRDRLDTGRMMDWLEAIFIADEERISQRVAEMDPELILSLLIQHVAVWPNDGDEMAPEMEQELARRDVNPTPDDLFFIEINGTPEEKDFIWRMLTQIYLQDVDLARSLLYRLFSQLPAVLEEEAYRLRVGRIEGLGFIEFYDALSIYIPLPKGASMVPRRPNIAGSELQIVPLAREVTVKKRGSFLSRVIRLFDQLHPRDIIGRDILHLANKLTSAERWDPGDEKTAHNALSRVHDYLGLGLELLSEGDENRGVSILREVHCERIFREAQTHLIALQRKANKGILLAQKTLGLPNQLIPWPDAPHRDIFESIKGRVPMMDPNLVGEKGDFRVFATVEDLKQAELAVDAGLSALMFLAMGLAIKPGNTASLSAAVEAQGGSLHCSHLLLTSLGNRILGKAFVPEPLTLEEARKVIIALRDDGAGPQTPKGLKPQILAQFTTAAAPFDDNGGASSLIQTSNEAFIEYYGRLDTSLPLDPRFAHGPLLFHTEATPSN